MSVSEAAVPAVSLWRRPGFSALLVGQTLSALGDSFSFVAIPLLVLHATGSVAQMGVVTALGGAAALVTGVFSGVLADRFDRRRLLIACDVARFALYAAVPVLWTAYPVVWPLYVVMPLAAAFGNVFQVTYVTVVPGLVPPEEITRANGRLYASYSAAFLVGPALAGLVSGRFGPAPAIAFDAATFAVSAVCIALIRVRTPVAAAPREPESLFAVFSAGVRFIAGHPVLRWLTVLLTIVSGLLLGLNDVIVYHVKHGLGGDDSVVGYVLATGIVGSLAASLLVARVRGRLGFGPTWVAANAVAGAGIAAVGWAGGVVPVAVLLALVMLCTSLGGISSMSLRQEVTPAHLLGRVTSAFWTLHSALAPLGAAALTAAAARFGVAATLSAAGALCAVTALIGLLTPLRRADRARISPAGRPRAGDRWWHRRRRGGRVPRPVCAPRR
ncbi:MFS transporter [Catellatospora sp. TT07R-123]|uniref:MFS transporter n=1 Tax=Catellatospora sp. TT07R-123 TaxID=2733863 RepID=UPI001B1DECB2|nr:MFS transporter [Catellatospora sp. TT07R-123]GHJ47781.1 MFS transporter [Catellatospora sp. TT07R-123]